MKGQPEKIVGKVLEPLGLKHRRFDQKASQTQKSSVHLQVADQQLRLHDQNVWFRVGA